MPLRRPQPLEQTPTVQIRFELEDPRSLTGTDQAEWLVPARRGDSILGAALDAGIQIEHTCGGACACSTCHVYVLEGADLLSEPQDKELDRLDLAPGVRPESRLACQARLMKSGLLRVRVPAWNRNLVRESGPARDRRP